MQLAFVGESHSYDSRVWYEDATQRTYRWLIEKVAAIISSDRPRADR